jgi:predicted metal-dependent phosphoesterase TrpH
MSSDLHLHTLVSDGELDPAAVLWQAASRGVTQLSITDHDALGAYTWEDGVVFEEAKRLGLELTVGIEMDADLDGAEVHLLGFSVGLDDAPLVAHLERVRAARFERARREIDVVNGLLGEGTITEALVFTPGRQTLMKPHFIRPILAKGHFQTYEDANAWYRKNVKSGVAVPKPSLEEAIALVKGAGGWAALAHPGYYDTPERPIAQRLAALKDMGLGGVEVDYPYASCSPRQWDVAREGAFLAALRAAAETLSLRVTRGSDCHTADDFDRVYGAPAPSGP